MNPRAARRLAASATLAAVAGLAAALSVLAVPRAGTPPRPATRPVVVHALEARAADRTARARRYWTADRMRRARLVGVRLAGTGRPRHRTRTRPVPAAPAAAEQPRSTGEVWTGGSLVTRTTGKVFFTLDGTDYVCSASVVDSANRDTVVTAGHCLVSNGRYVQNWEFVPGYHDGQAPYGRWTARLAVVPAGWAERGESALDVGFAVVDPRGGQHLADVVGSQPIGFGTAARWGVAFGYPVAAPYGGRLLVACAGPVRDGGRGVASGQGMACDMTDGSSGGPWFTGFDPRTGRGTVSGVNSFGVATEPGVLWAPVFGPQVRQTYETAQRS
jgi:V8-like Glu-specific endopeptidase